MVLINSLLKQNHRYLIYIRSEKANKGTVVNRALPVLHGWLLEITLTVPLTHFYLNRLTRNFDDKYISVFFLSSRVPNYLTKIISACVRHQTWDCGALKNIGEYSQIPY